MNYRQGVPCSEFQIRAIADLQRGVRELAADGHRTHYMAKTDTGEIVPPDSVAGDIARFERAITRLVG